MSTTTATLLVIKIQLQQKQKGHYCLGYLDNLILSFYCYRQNGDSALDQASFSGHHKVVKLLLGAGANPDLQDKVS